MKRLELLDYARFGASIGVLFFHYFFNGISNGKISSITYIPEIVSFVKYGYFSVPFFFMISGYVIFFSAHNKTPLQFFESRATRLYPAFWAGVIFTSFFSILWAKGTSMEVHTSQIFINLTMMPRLFGVDFVDGVYWTLGLELIFYAFVLAILTAKLSKHFESILMLWPIGILAATILGKNNIPLLSGFYCFFCAGSLLAIMKNDRSFKVISSCLLCFVLCLIFSLNKIPTFFIGKNITFENEVIVALVTAFFLFFIFANSNLGGNLKLPLSRVFGALTYPIYLIHAHFGYMFLSRYATEDNKLLIYPLTIILVISCAYLIHIFIEKRLAGFWHKLFGITFLLKK